MVHNKCWPSLWHRKFARSYLQPSKLQIHDFSTKFMFHTSIIYIFLRNYILRWSRDSKFPTTTFKRNNINSTKLNMSNSFSITISINLKVPSYSYLYYSNHVKKYGARHRQLLTLKTTNFVKTSLGKRSDRNLEV